MDKKLFVLVNPAAGKFFTKRVYPKIDAILDQSEVPFQAYFSSTHKSIPSTIQENLDETYTDLMVVGGDGTLNEVVNALPNLKLPIGIVQTGTGNDFSKNFCRGNDLEKKVMMALYGQVTPIDIGICNKRYFLNGVGIGFDGAVARSMLSNNRFNRGHWSYFLNVLKLLFRYKAPVVRVSGGDGNFHGPAFLTTIGNGTTFGGGFKLTPYAKTDDGLLDICILKDVTGVQRVLKMVTVLQSKHPEMDHCKYYKGRRVNIQCNRLVEAHIDGEWITSDSFDISIMKRGILLRVGSKGNELKD